MKKSAVTGGEICCLCISLAAFRTFTTLPLIFTRISGTGAPFSALLAGILAIAFIRLRYKGKSTLVEVKASNGNTKSTRTILAHPEKYHVSQAIKLGDYNVGRNEQLLTLPLYMAFMLKEY